MRLGRRTLMMMAMIAAAGCATSTEVHSSLRFRYELPGLHAHVEVRDYYVNVGRPLTLKPKSEVVFEIINGTFDVTAPSVKDEHREDKIWHSMPGDTVTVRAISQRSVLRARYVILD